MTVNSLTNYYYMSIIITNQFGTPYNSYFYSSIYERKYFMRNCFATFETTEEAQSHLDFILEDLSKMEISKDYQGKESKECIKKAKDLFLNCKITSN